MLQELINRVPIDAIIGETFRLRGSGRYLKGIEHDSLVIDLEKNMFYWNSIDMRGSSLDWLTKIQGMSYRQALETLQRFSGLPFTRILDKIDQPTPIYPKLLDTFYNLGKYYREYWYNRGLTDATIDYFKLGYTGKAYVIPIVLEGTLMNFMCRIGNGETKKVWNWASGHASSPFNAIKREEKYVFLTEGPTDVLAMHQIGLPSITRTGGISSWKQEWNRYIINYNYVYVIYDNDKAGIVNSRRVANKFLNRGYVLFWPKSFPDKFDVNECMLHFGEDRARRIILEAMVPCAVHASELNRAVGANRFYDKVDEIQMKVGRIFRSI